jgi:uncharacterized protein YcfJ
MKTNSTSKIFLSLFLITLYTAALAQQADPMAAVGKSPAQVMGLYVFGQKSQSAQTQSADELSCFSSAKTASNYDQVMAGIDGPVQAPAATGGAVGGAVGGAAAGAVIGAVAGDAEQGAKIGATAGALKGAGKRRRAAIAQHKAKEANAALDKKKTDALAELKRAFTACMDAKSYSVK